ncbi:heme exporter protein CcmD [Insolitispirillum peregrinum]|uniref:Heme exporter protein D n=1 Tax=Insolitispirillum peregrinum TaxID=80876 RepID=A0A1N7JJV4_9PROT|nr:heme exporter protein CcmD [Insolitispirillum peregrinum]SIS49608.1 heme exporter protein D [Insolitispirillum peregrinum]
MNDFLTMGGYGGYVWPAYAIALVVLVLVLVLTLRGAASSQKTLDLLQQARGGRRSRRGAAPVGDQAVTPSTVDTGAERP